MVRTTTIQDAGLASIQVGLELIRHEIEVVPLEGNVIAFAAKLIEGIQAIDCGLEALETEHKKQQEGACCGFSKN